jgi:glycosyltransferase involved in cell wall biosynthesis
VTYQLGGELDISVVVPAHNSGKLIERTVAELAERLQGRRAEIIVVENASTDDTPARCAQLADQWDGSQVAFSVLTSEKGMGNALRTGVLASRGAAVLLTADDLPFGFDDLDQLDRMGSGFGQGIPLVMIGSKAHPASVVERGAFRGTLTWGFSALLRAILRMRTRDPQGTLIVDGALARELAHYAVEPGYLFTTELIYIVERTGIRPTEVPVRLRASHHDHRSRITLGDMVAMAIGLLRIRQRHHARWRQGSITARPSAADPNRAPGRAAAVTGKGSAPGAASTGTAAAGTDSPPRSPTRLFP